MTTLLALKSFRTEQAKFLKHNYPELQILMPDQVTSTNLAQINILYGYQHGQVAHAQLLERILALPNMQLKWIQSLSAGVDAMPFAELKAHHILLTTASGTHMQSIAQNVFGYLLYFERGLKQALQAQAQRHYGIDANQVANLNDKTILIFGTGHIGQMIAKIAHAFEMHVLGVNHSGRAVAGFDDIRTDQTYDTILDQADYIVNIMPLTEATHHFFDASFFGKLTNQPIFINVGRGPSVDEGALVTALNQEKIKAAALDVFETEPLSIDSKLWNFPNVLITPHTSGYVEHFKQAYFKVFEPNLVQFMKDGTLVRNQVDLERKY